MTCDDIPMKICGHCGNVYPADTFPLATGRGITYRRGQCRACILAYYRRRSRCQPEKRRAYQRAHYHIHREKRLAAKRRYYQKHRLEILERDAERRRRKQRQRIKEKVMREVG